MLARALPLGRAGKWGQIAQKLEVTGHRAGKMSTRPSVWIVGSSLVVRLERWLRGTRGSDYDFDVEGDVEWFGQSGMT